MDEDLQRCVDMLKENEDCVRDDVVSTLRTIFQNILSRPEERKFREVRLNDPIVVEKLLPAVGAMECLFDVGFVEAADHLYLPRNVSLSRLQALQKLLGMDPVRKSHNTSNHQLYNKLPATTSPTEKKFFASMINQFESVMRYEDRALQEKARKLIPIVEFEIAVASKIRELQKRIKLNQTNARHESNEEQPVENDISARDLFLIELVHWFKQKFFTWVDSPNCSVCFGTCTTESVIPPTDPRCSRIELHRCNNCNSLVKFPRYSDPDPLLTLRRGRCGEWANVFTLLCRSLGYDARIVYDRTDHVWTEFWSEHEKRWIHVDPCENAIDKPLMYEKGWQKKLSYIIAYSKDEVQDVTWRYTRDHFAVLQRRKHCSESNLLQFIETLNETRQTSANYSSTRRQYVTERRLMELVQLIRMPNEQNVDDGENYQGRSTGSYAWKLARGEVAQDSVENNYSWDASAHGQSFELDYSIVRDTYRVVGESGRTLLEKSNWQEGVLTVEGGLFRKVENDWNMVYLTRSPGQLYGRVKWAFVVSKPNLSISAFNMQAVERVFHGANTSWELEAFFDSKDGNYRTVTFAIPDCSNYHTDGVKGARKLILTATVSGGEGDNAWQHAQLFRQGLDSQGNSMVISIRLIDL